MPTEVLPALRLLTICVAPRGIVQMRGIERQPTEPVVDESGNRIAGHSVGIVGALSRDSTAWRPATAVSGPELHEAKLDHATRRFISGRLPRSESL